MYWVDPKYHHEVNTIKVKLVSLGWSKPSHTWRHLAHGPIQTRVEAEELYNQWEAIVNPYGL